VAEVGGVANKKDGYGEGASGNEGAAAVEAGGAAGVMN